MTAIRTASLTDPATWDRIGTTEDGQAILFNPGNGMPAVRAPFDGVWYTPEAYAAVRLERIRAAAPELVELLRNRPVVHTSGAEYEAICAWQEKVDALLRRIEGE